MKIYVTPLAPNPTRLRLYLAEKRAAGASIAYEEVMINLVKGEQKSPQHTVRSPFTRVPVLELDDGTCVGESVPIIEYFEEKFPDPPMIGVGPEQRLKVRSLERLAGLEVLNHAARIVHATRSPLGFEPNVRAVATLRPRLKAGLKFFEETFADGREFVAGDSVTIADCTLAAALQFARFGRYECYSGHKAICAWDARYRARPAVSEVLTH
jgi:glutathione S-transferase